MPAAVVVRTKSRRFSFLAISALPDERDRQFYMRSASTVRDSVSTPRPIDLVRNRKHDRVHDRSTMMFSRWKTTISKTVPTTAQTAAAIQTGRVRKVAKLTEYRKPYQITKKTGQAGFLNVAFFGSRGLARISKP